jgi:predicted RND superfamily exporter protein
VVVVVATVVAGFGVCRIDFNDNPRDFFRTDDEAFRFMEEVFEQFGADENDCYLVVHSEQLFSQQALADLRDLVAEVEQIGGIESVLSLTDPRLFVFDPFPRPLLPASDVDSQVKYASAQQSAMRHPLVAGLLLGRDAERTLITARLTGNELSIENMQPMIDTLWSLSERWTATSTLEVQLTGIPAIRVEAFNLVRDQTARYTILGFLAGVIVVVLLMRRIATVFIVCVAAGAGAFWTVGALGLVGEQITILTTVLPMLVLVIGLTDAVHLSFDIRDSRSRGVTPLEATRRALRHLTAACLLTSITTVLGFASLSVTEIDIIRRFGLACAAGCGLAFLSVITVLPLLSSTRLGRGVLPGRGVGFLDSLVDWALLQIVNLSLRFRWQITSAGVLATVGLILCAMRLAPENEISESLPQDARSIVALRTVDHHFGGILPVFVTIDWPESVELSSPGFKAILQRVHDVCRQQDGVNHPFSLLNLMDAVPGIDLKFLPQHLLNSLVDIEGRRAVVVARTQDRGSAYLKNAFNDLTQHLKQIESEEETYRLRLTGSAVYATGIIDKMISDLASSLGLATIVIFGTMSIACRSIRIGLICLLPNALPLLITASVLFLIDGTLRFPAVVVFSVCLGIAVDDTIHLVSRFQRELHDCRDVEQALRRAVPAVGSALMVTTTVLLAGLAIPIGSDVPANRMFAILSCIAISAALLTDLILLPAMLACFVREPDRDV